jgi:hypothetical protein
LEEEKRKFDKDLDDMERRMSSKLSKGDSTNKNKDDDEDNDKTGYELME